jgi:hypothetical protein
MMTRLLILPSACSGHVVFICVSLPTLSKLLLRSPTTLSVWGRRHVAPLCSHATLSSSAGSAAALLAGAPHEPCRHRRAGSAVHAMLIEAQWIRRRRPCLRSRRDRNRGRGCAPVTARKKARSSQGMTFSNSLGTSSNVLSFRRSYRHTRIAAEAYLASTIAHCLGFRAHSPAPSLSL